MITIIFEDGIDFYFARQRVTREARPGRRRSCPPGVVAVPGPRRDGPRADLLVHASSRARSTRSTPAGCGRSTSSTSPRSSTRRRAWPRWPSSAACRWSTRSTCGRKTLRAYGVTLGELYAAVGRSNMPAGGGVDPEEQRRVHRPRRRLDPGQAGHREHRHQGGERHADLRQDAWPPCSSARSSAAACSRRTATKSPAASS